MSNEELDSIAKDLRELKNTYNVEWDNRDHKDFIDDESGNKGFDQIMDQVFNVMECYQQIDKDNETATIQKAKGAYIEAVKAACGFFADIAGNMIERARQMIKKTIPAKPDVVGINGHVNKCKIRIDKARQLWEKDDPKGLEDLRSVIEELDTHINNLELIVPGSVLTEEREVQRDNRAIWGIWILVAGLILKIILDFFSIDFSSITNPSKSD